MTPCGKIMWTGLHQGVRIWIELKWNPLLFLWEIGPFKVTCPIILLTLKLMMHLLPRNLLSPLIKVLSTLIRKKKFPKRLCWRTTLQWFWMLISWRPFITSLKHLYPSLLSTSEPPLHPLRTMAPTLTIKKTMMRSNRVLSPFRILTSPHRKIQTQIPNPPLVIMLTHSPY